MVIKKFGVLAVFAVSVGLLIGGCAQVIQESTQSTTTPPSYSLTKLGEVTLSAGSATNSTITGSTSLGAYEVTITAEAGCVDSNTSLTVYKADNPPAASFLGTYIALTFQPSGITFKKPITVRVQYDSAKMPSTEGLSFYAYDETAKTWSSLSSVGISSFSADSSTESASLTLSDLRKYTFWLGSLAYTWQQSITGISTLDGRVDGNRNLQPSGSRYIKGKELVGDSGGINPSTGTHQDKPYRLVFTFPHTGAAGTEEVTRAILYLFRDTTNSYTDGTKSTFGETTLSSHEPLVVEHIAPYYSFSNNLFSLEAITAGTLPQKTSGSIESNGIWYLFDVTDYVKADYTARRDRSSFRVRFQYNFDVVAGTEEGDGERDTWTFVMTESTKELSSFFTSLVSQKFKPVPTRQPHLVLTFRKITAFPLVARKISGSLPGNYVYPGEATPKVFITGPVSASVEVDATGIFEFNNLFPGYYVLNGTTSRYTFSPMIINASDADQAGIVFSPDSVIPAGEDP